MQSPESRFSLYFLFLLFLFLFFSTNLHSRNLVIDDLGLCMIIEMVKEGIHPYVSHQGDFAEEMM